MQVHGAGMPVCSYNTGIMFAIVYCISCIYNLGAKDYCIIYILVLW